MIYKPPSNWGNPPCRFLFPTSLGVRTLRHGWYAQCPEWSNILGDPLKTPPACIFLKWFEHHPKLHIKNRWFGCHLDYFPWILGCSSQLTNSYFSEGWRKNQPVHIKHRCSIICSYDCRNISYQYFRAWPKMSAWRMAGMRPLFHLRHWDGHCFGAPTGGSVEHALGCGRGGGQDDLRELE